MDFALRWEFPVGSTLYAAECGCDFGSLDWSETMLYSPSFVFLWTRPFNKVNKTTFSDIGASRKAEVASDQLLIQINVIKVTPKMILD